MKSPETEKERDAKDVAILKKEGYTAAQIQTGKNKIAKIRKANEIARKEMEKREALAKKEADLAMQGRAKVDITASGAFKEFITAINSVLDEANLNFTKTGIEVTSMDPSGIAMVVASADKNEFSKWDVKKAGGIGLNLDSLKEGIAKIQKDSLIHLSGDGTHLKMEFSDKSGKQKVELPYIDVRNKGPKEPKSEFTGSFTLKGDDLKSVISAAKNQKQQYLTIEVGKGKVGFSAKGDVSKFSKNEKTPTAKTTKPTRATFNLDYLRNFVKALDKDAEVDVSLGTDYPMMLEYKTAIGKVRYWLAPFVEEEPEKPKKKTKAEIKAEKRAEKARLKTEKEAAAKAEKEKMNAPEPKKTEKEWPMEKNINTTCPACSWAPPAGFKTQENYEKHLATHSKEAKPPEGTEEKKRLRA